MERKDSYLLTEFLITALLLLILTFLFGEKGLAYRPYLAVGLTAGFSFSWFMRKKSLPLVKHGINIAFVAVFIWVVRSLWQSTLSYLEVITIFVQGGILLEIILSFDSSNPASLAYLQALSLPLFMCFPAFVKQYDSTHIILVLSYFLGWAVILKVKFYESFISTRKNELTRYYSFILSVFLFALTIFVSWEFFQRILLGRIEKGGILLEEGTETKIKEEAKEKEFYEDQDELQTKISRLIPDFEYKEDRHETLFMLSSLLKESPDTMEVNKAEKGLIDKLQRPGPGLAPSESDELTLLINNYVTKKTSILSQRARSNIMNALKNNPFNIEQRMNLTDQINKMQESGTRQELNKNTGGAREVVNNSSVSKTVKSQIGALVERMKDIETLKLYREQSDVLNKKAGSLEDKAKEELKNISSAIDKAENLPELGEAKGSLESAKASALGEYKDLIKQLEEILGLKSDMLVSKQGSQIKEKLGNSILPQQGVKELSEMVDEVCGTQDPGDLSQGASQLQEEAKESQVPILEELQKLIEMKAYLLAREGKDRINEKLKEGVLPDSGKGVMKEIEKMESRKEPDKLDSDFKALKEELEKFYGQGFISESTKNNLLKEIESLKDLQSLKLKAQELAKSQEAGPPASRKDNYQQELKDLIDKSSLKENSKEVLQQLADGIFKAQMILLVENMREGVGRELNDCIKKGFNKEEADKISDEFNAAIEIQKKFIMDMAFSGIREKIEDLKNTGPQQADKIKEQLDKMRDSPSMEELKKQMSAFKDLLSSQGQDKKSGESEESGKKPDGGMTEKSLWQIYVLPSRVVLAAGNSVGLKVIAVYDKVFIKELNSDVEWFSSNPKFVEVNRSGIVNALSEGSSRVGASYKGKDSELSEIVVVGRTSQETEELVKKEIGVRD